MNTSRKLPLYFTLFGLVAVLFFQACTFRATDSTPSSPQGGDSDVIFTMAAETGTAAALIVERELTLIASGVTLTPTPVDPNRTGTELPLISPTPSGDDDSGSGSSDPCNAATFIDDVTVPDFTVFAPGEAFDKTWRIKNSGSCTWNSGYQAIFEEGDSMGAPASVSVTDSTVPPGGEVDVTITLTAPILAGNYRGDWQLRDATGQVFGLGAQRDGSFWVAITVEEAPEFNLTYDNTHTCDDLPNAVILIQSLSTFAFESAEITLTNATKSTTLHGPFAHNGPFMANGDECPPGASVIAPQGKGYIGGLVSGALAGDLISAIVKICTEDDLQGICTEKSINFTVP